MSMRESLFV